MPIALTLVISKRTPDITDRGWPVPKLCGLWGKHICQSPVRKRLHIVTWELKKNRFMGESTCGRGCYGHTHTHKRTTRRLNKRVTEQLCNGKPPTAMCQSIIAKTIITWWGQDGVCFILSNPSHATPSHLGSWPRNGQTSISHQSKAILYPALLSRVQWDEKCPWRSLIHNWKSSGSLLTARDYYVVLAGPGGDSTHPV